MKLLVGGLIPQLPGEDRRRGFSPVIHLYHLHRCAHVAGHFEDAKYLAERHNGTEITQTVERVYLPEAIRQYARLSQHLVELVDEREDFGPVFHREEPIVGLGTLTAYGAKAQPFLSFANKTG